MGIEKVLVVDDEGSWRHSTVALLASESLKVEAIASADELQGKSGYGLYIIDGLDGKWPQAVDAVRRNDPTASIILWSATPKKYATEAQSKYGLTFYDKDVSIEDLVAPLINVSAK
jgi:DNA-binding NtrC family response regulator